MKTNNVKLFLIFVIFFVSSKIAYLQSCGSISCPSGYYLSTRCCNSGSCSTNNSDGNPYTGCDGGGCSAAPDCSWGNCDKCCECTPISTPHPCGSCIPSSCPGGTVFINTNQKFVQKENRESFFNWKKQNNKSLVLENFSIFLSKYFSILNIKFFKSNLVF